MFKFFQSLSKKPSPTLWRQGDVFLIATPSVPTQGRMERRPVLAEGEATGHAHRLQDPASGHVFSAGGNLYLEVIAESATIIHEEHKPVTVPRGGYTIRIQREYSPKEIRRVVD
ncbi:MAG: hypothetical protein JWR26_3108 [Pedosphaera sp.]|nr:hypothetical protein [Pedosphaera sp.]